jgi:hypothetical protein
MASSVRVLGGKELSSHYETLRAAEGSPFAGERPCWVLALESVWRKINNPGGLYRDGQTAVLDEYLLTCRRTGLAWCRTYSVGCPAWIPSRTIRSCPAATWCATSRRRSRCGRSRTGPCSIRAICRGRGMARRGGAGDGRLAAPKTLLDVKYETNLVRAASRRRSGRRAILGVAGELDDFVQGEGRATRDQPLVRFLSEAGAQA